MGKYLRNKEDFEVLIGPFTNKIVTTLGKELRKKQKSCQNHKLEKTLVMMKSVVSINC